jgi:5-(carboxyamino)imidazole ribonucleotide synthase
MSQNQRPRVGVLGAGQLALMLAQAGAEMGVDVICAGSRGTARGGLRRWWPSI